MRILLLSTGGKIGGEETFTRNLALCHLLYNWQVRIILLILLLRRKAHLQNLCHR